MLNVKNICLHCGDEGAANAFVYCVYCLKYAVHRYCLHPLPETLDEFVHWVCEDCDEAPQNVPSSTNDIKTGRKKDQCTTSSKHIENDDPKGKKHVQGRKTDNNNMVFKSSSENSNTHKGTKKDKLLFHNGVADLEEIDEADNNELESNKLKERNDERLATDSSSSQSGINQPQPHGSPLSDSSSLDSPVEEFCDVAEPIIDPIWSGSFNIVNSKKESDEEQVDRLIVAHLSKKVGKQVHDEAKSFPSMLELELHPKAQVWPKRFHMLKPSDCDIAVYFFPLTGRYEGVFDELVEEMMDQELALKAVTENAELLIFPSNELPLRFWRFHGKYFLWGVFRGKQPRSSSEVASTITCAKS